MEHKIVNEAPDLMLLAKLGYNESAIDVVQKLLNKNPVARLSMTATLKCSWFKKGHDMKAWNEAVATDLGKRFETQVKKATAIVSSVNQSIKLNPRVTTNSIPLEKLPSRSKRFGKKSL